MNEPRRKSGGLLGDRSFFWGLWLIAFVYIGFIVALVSANLSTVTWPSFESLWTNPDLRASTRLTLLTCSISAILSLLLAVPIAYLLSRYSFRGRGLIDAILDIPIILPPLVIGLSLLLLFNRIPFFPESGSLEATLNQLGMSVTFSVPAIILAQSTVATAFAVRLVKTAFEQIDVRAEQVALTLGCSRASAFWKIALPQAGQGIVAAGILAWARALGEFGPILVFAGATRGRTEVLATSVFLEINIGNIAGAAAVSLLMIVIALSVIAFIRFVTRDRQEQS